MEDGKEIKKRLKGKIEKRLITKWSVKNVGWIMNGNKIAKGRLAPFTCVSAPAASLPAHGVSL